MQIYGSGPLYGPQSISSAQSARAPLSAELTPSSMPHDHVEISEMGLFLESLSSVSEMRFDRIQQLREAIADGSYDTEERMSAALDNLLDEIG